MNSDYGRRDEPFPLSRPDEPSMLATAATIAEKNGITLERLATEARLSLDDVASVIGGSDPRPAVQI